ncbi:NUDIX domain-containing protein [Viridibacillus sp. NPDC093762]|uniref:NUDIX domain-containing protein n=1 Tax=Viridibacillus sp. NPDC093762 TaxID=3390720 RepID=UPI003D012E97
MINENEIIVAVKGIILNEGKLLIVQRDHNDEIGGGEVEFGEDLEAALVKEIKEEVDISLPQRFPII